MARGVASSRSNANRLVPGVYQDLLAEALPNEPRPHGRSLKRRRVGTVSDQAVQRNIEHVQSNKQPATSTKDEDDSQDDDLEFEDVVDVFGDVVQPQGALQTAFRDTDDETADSDEDFDLDLSLDSIEGPTRDLELTLNPTTNTRAQRTPRRRALGKDERNVRIHVHKMHVLCLLAHVERRNKWCNNAEVQDRLQKLLTKKMRAFLLPKQNLSQFGRTESLKRGLEQACAMWTLKYSITARGMQRALWAENPADLRHLELADDTETALELTDFLQASTSLKGSRDLGAQLFCALLRGLGLDVRLVCSLQPLAFAPGGPTSRGASQAVARSSSPEVSEERAPSKASVSLDANPRARLGHHDAAGYHVPAVRASSHAVITHKKRRRIVESAMPITWIEVLDEAHQKWLPIDPLVTHTIAKSAAFEPPASDRLNSLSYVIAFEDDGIARDVTKRYTKAYNGKTRKLRVESTADGAPWWRKAMHRYERRWLSDIDQLEDAELAAAEAREPMPRNVVDFKDHPMYALERHLKRHEVLIRRQEIGKVAVGKAAGEQGKKKLESVYRRSDVRIGKSADAWYRMGRDVKMGEIPAKFVTARRRPDMDAETAEQMGDLQLFTEEQTELYVPPPIVDGKVPKNSFGNLDIYVPSMIPAGAMHITDPQAVRTARLLGIDYAEALTGFEFRGRHGTPILKGIIIASEFGAAVEAVLERMHDEEARAMEERKSANALRVWKRFLMGLRIKQRVDAYGLEDEVSQAEPARSPEPEAAAESSDDDEDMDDQEYVYDEDEGGGFFPE